jgi:RNA recognition motif-containing protein
MSTNVYVGNLSYKARDEDLAALFSDYGEVISARVILDRETKRSRGFGFVEMADREAALKAIQELDQKEFMDRPLRVNEAQPKRERGPRREGPRGR